MPTLLGGHREYGDDSARRNKLVKYCGGADGGADRLSSLPDSILCHILSLLPTTKDAIKTSVLSKSWQFLWTSVSTLAVTSSSSATRFSVRFNKFSRSVEKTLTHHSALKITKFVISCPFEDTFKSRIDCWVRYALDRRVEHLTLNFRTGFIGGTYLLPCFLYTHQDLTKLTIRQCRIRPPEIINLPLLKDLSLEQAGLGNADLAKILSGCPLLESLELFRCGGTPYRKICSASLKRLTVHETYSSVIFKDAWAIEVATPKLESLRLLGAWHFEDDSPVLIAASSVVDFELHWASSKHRHTSIRTRFNQFLQAFPKLESLSLHAYSLSRDIYVVSRDIVEAGKAFWRLQGKTSTVSCLEHHLKRVEIIGFGPNKEGWEFIDPLVEFLLKNACVLENLAIRVQGNYAVHKPRKPLTLDEALMYMTAAQQMLSYQRISPAVVMFEN